MFYVFLLIRLVRCGQILRNTSFWSSWVGRVFRAHFHIIKNGKPEHQRIFSRTDSYFRNVWGSVCSSICHTTNTQTLSAPGPAPPSTHVGYSHKCCIGIAAAAINKSFFPELPKVKICTTVYIHMRVSSCRFKLSAFRLQHFLVCIIMAGLCPSCTLRFPTLPLELVDVILEVALDAERNATHWAC